MRPGGTVPCVSCGHAISRYTRTCPRCGAPQPHKRIGSSIGLGVMLVLLLVVMLWGALA